MMTLITLCGLGAFIPMFLSLFTPNGEVPVLGLMAGIWCGICCVIMLWLLSKKYPEIAAYPPMLLASFLIIKPKIAPITYEWGSQHGEFPLCSETHLYFIVPGVIVIIVGLIYLLISGEGGGKS